MGRGNVMRFLYTLFYPAFGWYMILHLLLPSETAPRIEVSSLR